MLRIKLSSKKWFTIMELMIVIAIIGILTAALIPSVSSYLMRWRDSERIADINEVSRGLVGYFGTFDKYPSANNCLIVNFISWFVSPDTTTDTYLNRDHWCGSNGIYGYWSWFINAQHYFSMSAYLENPLWWSYNATWSNNPFTWELNTWDLTSILSMKKWSWPLYVLSQ